MNTNDPRPILCGTDFSESATEAMRAASALAQRFNSPLILAHSVDERAEFPDHLRHRLMNDGRPQLAEEAKRLRKLGLTFEEKLLGGAPDDGVASFARSANARLVVVGASGTGSVGRWVLGNVAERIAESSPVPTLVVHSAEPFLAWVRGERALRIFVGADFTASSNAALRWVAELQKLGPCEVIAGYADWTPEEAARLGVHGAMALVGNPLVVQSILERDVKAKVAEALGEENVRVVVQGGWGRTDAQLIGMAAEAQADLIVVGTHQRQGLRRLGHVSVSRGIVHSAAMSVACVPTPAADRMTGPRIRECRRVLVAVDLDEKYGFVAPHAYGITSPGGTVRLVHVAVPFHLPNPAAAGSGQESPIEREHFDPVAQSEARLRALAPDAADVRGITTEVEVIDDREIAHAICAAAERLNADTICIGSHTRPGFGAKALGSVSLAVLQQCRRPVLVVWPPAE